jgi:hypothetical protein
MEPSRSGFAAYNPNSPSVRRIMKEYKEMKNDTSTLFRAAPLEVCTTKLIDIYT